MRWLWLLPLRFVAGLTGRLLRYGVMMLVVAAVSLSFSIASFVIPGLATVMFRAASAIANTAVVGVQQAQHLRQRNAELRQINDRQRSINSSLSDSNVEHGRANRQLARQNTQLATTNTDLEARNARLATMNADLEARNARLMREQEHRRAAVQSRAQRISNRSARATTRSVAMIPLESVPFLGAATIIATTSLDIHDTCATLEDMATLQRELGIDPPEDGVAAHICSAVPVAGRRADRYGDMTISECRAAAEEAHDEVLKLTEQQIDLPPDEQEAFEDEVRELADEERVEITRICDCIARWGCDPAELALR